MEELNLTSQTGAGQQGFQQVSSSKVIIEPKAVKKASLAALNKASTGNVFECDFYGCSKTFKSKYSLQRHYFLHYVKKTLKCKYCPKKFSLPQYLEEHQYTHTGVKPNRCQFCEATFRQRGKLSIHQRVCRRNPKNSTIS